MSNGFSLSIGHGNALTHEVREDFIKNLDGLDLDCTSTDPSTGVLSIISTGGCILGLSSEDRCIIAHLQVASECNKCT